MYRNASGCCNSIPLVCSTTPSARRKRSACYAPIGGNALSTQISSGGRKELLSRPKVWSCSSHWHSCTSVLRPGRFLVCRAFTRKNPQAGFCQDLVDRKPIDTGGLH